MIIGEILIIGIFVCLNGNVVKIKLIGGKFFFFSFGLYLIKFIIVNFGSFLFSCVLRKVVIVFEYLLIKMVWYFLFFWCLCCLIVVWKWIVK